MCLTVLFSEFAVTRTIWLQSPLVFVTGSFQMLSWFASVTCTCPKNDLDAFMATISTAAAVAKGPLAPLTPFSTWFFHSYCLLWLQFPPPPSVRLGCSFHLPLHKKFVSATLRCASTFVPERLRLLF